MSTTTAPFEQLPELYLGTLVSDAYYEGFAGTIVSAINSWHDVLEVTQPDQQSQRRPHQVNAASTFTRHAMGLLEATIGLISRDSLHETADWARIDRYWDNRSNPADDAWAHAQLMQQAERCWGLYRSYAHPEGSQHNDGLHCRWIHDLAMAATFLQAAALLIADAFGIEEVEA